MSLQYQETRIQWIFWTFNIAKKRTPVMRNKVPENEEVEQKQNVTKIKTGSLYCKQSFCKLTKYMSHYRGQYTKKKFFVVDNTKEH